jgi:hypothetical protein
MILVVVLLSLTTICLSNTLSLYEIGIPIIMGQTECICFRHGRRTIVGDPRRISHGDMFCVPGMENHKQRNEARLDRPVIHVSKNRTHRIFD